MSYQIRKMIAADHSNAIKLWRSLPGIALSSADEFTDFCLFLKMNPNTCFIAQDREKIIGTVLGGSDSRRGYLYHLAVHPDYQKQGVGKQLTEKCLNALKSQGIKKCHIFVVSSNTEGLRFWEKLGWLLRKDILVMSKDL